MASSPRKPRVLVGVSGSVATVKVPELTVRLAEFAEVKIVVTKSADFFLQRAKEYHPSHWDKFEAIRESVPVLRDADEWICWDMVGDPVVHIELKDWADLIVVTPLSANTLAKLANGMSDNLLTSVCRAWMMSKPFLYAPAMNTDMWDHPMTARHLRILDELRYEMIEPVEKKLACGVIG
ncbi:hypothetical protein Poli38472_013828 [Pythium oligandrum]|uniref:Flavoprotein domain-containing protein n=1 Tax=Pythium oligandrum TaxID=41045 RepID=A0A8K1FAH4_PYTOL|nr:hypothetical protein Poli38472_013828 [Pythium oligandrum]|eukprot:TMW55066.1 hypothetical protein Poli38472_013828 [Pythium oligandrum]